MTTVTRAFVPNDNSAWNSFFNGFNNPLLVGYTNASNNRCFKIGENLFDLQMQRSNGYVYAYYKGTQFYANNGWSAGASNETIVAIDNNFVYLLMYGASDGYYAYRSLLFIYDAFNDLIITGHRGYSDGTVNNLNTLTFTDENTSDQYTYPAILKYSVPFTKIDYAPQYLFKNSLITSTADTHFLSCSNTTFDRTPRVLTFGGMNYYVAGTNTLIPITGGNL